MEQRKTRIAPTPSGFLHIGNVYSFLITQAIARKESAKMLLRIDDMDAARVRPEYINDIFDTLAFMEIKWDEGPRDPSEAPLFSQTSRRAIYDTYFRRLAADKLVYACKCSRRNVSHHPHPCLSKRYSLDEPGVSWRLRTQEEFSFSMQHYQKDPTIHSLPESMKDFVIRKKNGDPSYQLCSLADDVNFGINLIVRGVDLFDSTLAQIYLARLLNLSLFSDLTLFLHHPLLKDDQGAKLSKSAGSTSIMSLRKTQSSRSDILRMIDSAGDHLHFL